MDDDFDTSNNTNHCEPLCATDADCAGAGGSFGCNPWSRLCELKDKGLTKYGGACSSDTQCETGRCSTYKPGGYCLGLCSGTALSCGGTGFCVYNASFGDNVGACLQGCGSTAQCRGTPYTCQDVGSGTACWCTDSYLGGADHQICVFDFECCSGSCGYYYMNECD
ncbi:MAG: hypothetical protein ACYC8T_10885 [Myxococcaceae bacterium]